VAVVLKAPPRRKGHAQHKAQLNLNNKKASGGDLMR
jgi:hypothetical protein